jgi:PAS domain S-box-containing protein
LSRTSGRSASRLAAILDALPDALLLVDAAGQVVNANAVALDLFEGESAERLLGKPVSVLLPGLGRAVATAGPGPAALPVGSAAPEGAGPRAPQRGPAERLAARRTDGSLFPAEVNTATLPDDEDELTLYVVRDLTGVLDVEAELRRQQRQIELILRAASEGIIGVDNEARIVLVNPAGARILRHRASDLGGQDVHELIAHSAADGTPIPPEKVLLVDSLRTGTRHRATDQVLWRSDGTAVTVDMTTAPVSEGDVIIGAVMTFEDNSEARASVRRAQELADVLDDELRGPLAAVLNELRNVAEYGIGELGPNVRQALSSATSDLAEVAGLVDDIVDYQHMVVGDQPFEPRVIRLSEVVDAAVEATEDAAAALGVDLIAHTADVEVSVDPDLFAKMLAHLLADMVTASPVGGKVVVTAARRGPVARIEIRGPHTGGGPLHLPIARAIVAQHGGTVTTHRIAGKGNTHVVEVPLEGSGGGGKGSARTTVANSSRSVRVAQVLPTARVRAAVARGGDSATGMDTGTGTGAGQPPAQAFDQGRGLEQGRGPVSGRMAGQGPSELGQSQQGRGAEQSAAPGAVKQVEKTNGHHTSHGADIRRPVTAAPGQNGQNGQARIPAQARSPLRPPGPAAPLDLKPSRPLPTSDVWSRPRRDPASPALDDSGSLPLPEPPPVRGNAGSAVGAGVTAPSEQQPWQPEADPQEELEAAAEAFNAAAEAEIDFEDDEEDAEPTLPVPQQAPPRAADEGMQPRGRRRAVTPDPFGRDQFGQEQFGQEQGAQDRAGRVSRDQFGQDRASEEPPAQNTGRQALRPVTVSRPPRLDVGRGTSQRTPNRDTQNDQPTQRMPPVTVDPPRPPRPAPAQPERAERIERPERTAGLAESNTARPGPLLVDDDEGPALLLWPEPDSTTVDLLDERGYLSVPLDNFDALPRTLAEHLSQGSVKPSAVLVDPIAAPITRRGLRILRGAAINAGLPIVVTAGIGGGPPEAPQGPDPALLLQALTPPAVSLPRVLLVEARDDLADAMTRSLERQGMQVLHAATDSESISRASDGVPDVVLMDLMQIRRRRTGIVEWLRDHERLTTTPIVVYTALGTDSAPFAAVLRSGNASLFLAERATDSEVSNRIGDLLAKICTGG